MRKNKKNTPADAKFGMFKGVFTPSILTILGVIMYLRFGWVVGHGGLIGAIGVVLLAHVISLTTGLSISSIATNRTVKAGGDYFMISRSLGLPIGGAIGLALFVALALSMSLYLLGFAEAFLEAFGFDNTLRARQIIGSAACVFLTVLTFFSTSLALKVQYVVLVLIALSLVSFFTGSPVGAVPDKIPLWFSGQEGAISFEVVFAVFFPAVTGFTAGVAMSGDLKDPRRAIPRGTLLAILVGLVAYIAIPVYFSLRVDPQLLKDDPMIWLKVARFPALVVAGIFAATLSSALGSVLGAPRYLQALAMDGVVPGFLGKGHGPLNEPRIGTVATFFIAEAGIMMGEMDAVARIITMFFLASYGFLSFACAVQTWSGVPSFRPDFKTPAWVSLIGATTCLAVMFKVDTLAMLGATVIMVLIYLVLKRRQFKVTPKDSWAGFWAAVVQKGIMHLHGRVVDSQNWRPNAIVFGGEPAERSHLVRIASWVVQNRGLATYFMLLDGDVQKEAAHARRLEPSVRDIVDVNYPEMLTRVVVARDLYRGILNISQSYGLAGMIPNTVIMGWGEESDRPAQFTDLVRGLLALDHNLIFVDYAQDKGFGVQKSLDVWWGGLERNGELMLLIAYLITSSPEWQDATIRLITVVNFESEKETATKNMNHIIKDARVPATPHIIVNAGGVKPVPQIMREESAHTSLSLIGLRPPAEDEDGAYVDHIASFVNNLGSTLMVRASTQFEGAALLFDE